MRSTGSLLKTKRTRGVPEHCPTAADELEGSWTLFSVGVRARVVQEAPARGWDRDLASHGAH